MSNPNHRRTPIVNFDDVRRKVNLVWFLEQHLGVTAKPSRGTLRFSACPSCGAGSKHSVRVSVQDDKWRCFACNDRGDVIDAAAKLWGKSQRDAALSLVGEDLVVDPSYIPPKPLPVDARNDEAVSEVIGKLVARSDRPSREAIAYFRGRGITAKVVTDAVERGLLVTLPARPDECKEYLIDVLGEDLLRTSGLWKEGARAPACVFRPLLFVAKNLSCGEFRMMRIDHDGEIKSMRFGGAFPWAWRGESLRDLLITEGPMDMLAAVTMGSKRTIMGLPGCNNWEPEWFSKLTGLDVLTGLDSDKYGKLAQIRLTEHLTKEVKANTTAYEFVEEAKDINDELILENPHCYLYFFEDAKSEEIKKRTLLALPGCDGWSPWQFGRISGHHVRIRLGGERVDDKILHTLGTKIKAAGATVSLMES